jgi:hypothetical protein
MMPTSKLSICPGSLPQVSSPRALSIVTSTRVGPGVTESTSGSQSLIVRTLARRAVTGLDTPQVVVQRGETRSPVTGSTRIGTPRVTRGSSEPSGTSSARS